MDNKKCWDIVTNGTEVDLYIYGEIVSEKQADFWTGETSDTDIDITEFTNALAGIKSGQTLNIYFNSPGGEVFTASAMASQISRLKSQGVTVNSYIDGVAISAASFLVMAADNIYVYKNSMMMIHRPMTIAMGNVDDFNSVIAMLEQTEDGSMMPLYMAHSTASEDDIKSMLAAETWLTSEQIVNIFGATLLDEQKQVAAFDRTLFARYKNVPENLKPDFDGKMAEKIDAISAKLDKLMPKNEEPKKAEIVDYSAFEKQITEL